jgi:hypothetical protein
MLSIEVKWSRWNDAMRGHSDGRIASGPRRRAHETRGQRFGPVASAAMALVA